MLGWVKGMKGRWLVFLLVGYCSACLASENVACGKMSGNVIEVPRAYLFFWPEYEGKSSWEKDFNKNKKGCDANLTSIAVETFWPEMSPAGEYTLEDDKKVGHVRIAIQPAPRLRDGDLSEVLSRVLDWASVRNSNHHIFKEKLGLFYARGIRSAQLELGNDIYWHKEEGGVDTVIECLLLKDGVAYKCSQQFYSFKLNALVELDYKPELLRSWREVAESVKVFIGKLQKQGVKE